MTRSAKRRSHGLSVMMVTVLFALLPSGGHAQDDMHLQMIFNKDGELQSIQQHVTPCLNDAETVAAIAGSFREATGVELSEFAAAVSDRDDDPDVWRGDYEDYTFGSRVRIATAPLVEPNLLPRVGTAYAFPLSEVLASGELNRRHLTKQVVGGSVGVAEYEDGFYPFVLPGNESWRRAVDLMQEQESDINHLDDDSTSPPDWLIARRDTLHGVNSSARVIAWDTDMPLNTVLLDAYRTALLVSIGTTDCENREIRRAILDRYAAQSRPQ